LPNSTGSSESEKRTARKTTAQRIPRFITKESGVNFFSLNISLAYRTKNKTVANTNISFSSRSRKDNSE
jgi:hypothetical protein